MCCKFLALKENSLLFFQNYYSNLGDQDLQLEEGLGRALPTHAQNFETHPSFGCHSPPKNRVLPLSFMLHLVPSLIANHLVKILEKILMESHPAAKKFSFLSPEKSPSSNSNFHVIIQYKLHL